MLAKTVNSILAKRKESRMMRKQLIVGFVAALVVLVALVAVPEKAESLSAKCVECAHSSCGYKASSAHRECEYIAGGCFSWGTCTLEFRITP